MTDVLVASLREEGARVTPIVEGLRAAGLSVWWEGDLAAGEHRQQKITNELAAAKCVVVVWTAASVSPAGELVQDVAVRAKERGLLVPVRLDRVTEPLGFGQIRSLDLARWNGKPRHRRFKQVVAAVRAVAAGQPQPQARTETGWLRWTARMTVVLAVLLPLLSFFSDLHEVQASVCRVAGVRALCARWQLGGVATPEEEEAWAARRPGDCAALREHLARFPDGVHAEEAHRRLLAAETETTERWGPQVQRLPLTVRSTREPLAGEEAARADALVRAGEEARLVCAGFNEGPFRLRTATAEVREWHCSPRQGGAVCGFDGWAVCHVEARTLEQRDICR
jgi:TIR domain